MRINQKDGTREGDVGEKIQDVLESRIKDIGTIPAFELAEAIAARLRRLGLLRERDSITPKDMRHLIGRAERILKALGTIIDGGDGELTMATFKLSNTCKAWRKALKARGGEG